MKGRLTLLYLTVMIIEIKVYNFSYTYIATAILLNLCVIIVAYWNGKNVFTAFWYVLTQMWDTIMTVLK